jgi:hypothetical protein
MSIMAEKTSPRWDLIMKAASLCCTIIIVPGIGWAFSVSSQIGALEGRINMLSSQMDSDRRGMSAIVEELRHLRTSVDGLKADVLQRISKVETKLESR